MQNSMKLKTKQFTEGSDFNYVDRSGIGALVALNGVTLRTKMKPKSGSHRFMKSICFIFIKSFFNGTCS